MIIPKADIKEAIYEEITISKNIGSYKIIRSAINKLFAMVSRSRNVYELGALNRLREEIEISCNNTFNDLQKNKLIAYCAMDKDPDELGYWYVTDRLALYPTLRENYGSP